MIQFALNDPTDATDFEAVQLRLRGDTQWEWWEDGWCLHPFGAATNQFWRAPDVDDAPVEEIATQHQPQKPTCAASTNTSDECHSRTRSGRGRTGQLW